MKQTRLYPSVRTEELTKEFPDWTAIKRNPTSNGRGLLNVFAIEFDGLEKKMKDVNNQILLKTCNTDEIDHTWSFDISLDMSGSDVDYVREPASVMLEVKSAELINTEYGTFGEIAGSSELVSIGTEIIELDIITDEDDFYKASPDAYMFREVFNTYDDANNLLNCQRYYNGGNNESAEFAIRVLSSEHQTYHNIYLPKFDDHANINRNVANKLTTIDGNMTEQQLTVGVVLDGEFFVFKDRVDLDNLVIFRKSDNPTADVSSGIEIEGYEELSYHEREGFYHKVYLPNELNSENYMNTLDFNNDGFITISDRMAFEKMVGLNAEELNLTDEQWEEQYGDYDLSAPKYEITEEDLNAFDSYMTQTHITNKSIIQFTESGEYIIVANVINNYGISGFLESGDELYDWRANDYNKSLLTKHDSNYADVAFDENTKYFYYTDNNNKCIQIKTFNERNEVADTHKIPMPLKSINDELRGLCIDDNGLLHVVVCNSETLESSIYQIDTYSADVLDTIKEMQLNYEVQNDDYDDEYIIVNNYPLLNAHGITEFSGNRLAVTAGSRMYVLKPVYFKAIYSNQNKMIHTRIKGDKISIDGNVHYGKQFWYHVWNEFDEHALKFGINRLLGETNYDLRDRLIDSYKRPGAPSEQGYLYSIRRNIGLDTYDINQNKYIFLENNPVELPGNESFDDQEIEPAPGQLFNISSIDEHTFTLKKPKIDNYGNIMGYVYTFWGFSSEADVPDDNEDETDLSPEIYGMPLFELDGKILKRLYDYQSEFITIRIVEYKYDIDGATAITRENFSQIGVKRHNPNRMEIVNMKDHERLRESKYELFIDEVPTDRMKSIATELISLEKATYGTMILDNSYYNVRSIYRETMDSFNNKYQIAPEYDRS